MSQSPPYVARPHRARALISQAIDHAGVDSGLPNIYMAHVRHRSCRTWGGRHEITPLSRSSTVRSARTFVRGKYCVSSSPRFPRLGFPSPLRVEKERNILATNEIRLALLPPRHTFSCPRSVAVCFQHIPYRVDPVRALPQRLTPQEGRLFRLCAIAITLATPPKPLLSIIGYLYRLWEGLIEH
jgi:hypothetical protein